MNKRQLIGAFGEKAVEAELLRNGWVAGNVNKSAPNAKGFDLFAFQSESKKRVDIQVKTKGLQTKGSKVPSSDFSSVGRVKSCTIFVKMGLTRDEDSFVIKDTAATRDATSGTDSQITGSFGEKAVEAELWRRKWQVANINSSIRNAPRYDLLARKGVRQIQVSVKTCGSNKKNETLMEHENFITSPYTEIGSDDFTIVVRQGASRCADRFLIIPTWIELRAFKWWRWIDDIKTADNPEGRNKKNTGTWVLRWPDRRKKDDGIRMFKCGWEKEWTKYEENWDILDEEHTIPDSIKAEILDRSRLKTSTSYEKLWREYRDPLIDAEPRSLGVPLSKF